ncbi:MAG: hypothetical protein NZ821_03125 [Gloeomargarita sp. SKYB31]|nr:hypothetical protein [Gloeomargarita sp. SKYB31]
MQGPEYAAVRWGTAGRWPVVPMPLGARALADWWTKYQGQLQGRPVVLLGLAGALTPGGSVGMRVVCQSCRLHPGGETRRCDPELTQWLAQQLDAPIVQSLTTQRIVTQPQEKQQLGERFDCAVVEMEGYELLGYLPRLGMVRVVSDGMTQPLPDLNAAMTPATGQINLLRLGQVMVQQPQAAWMLVHQGWRSITELTAVARRLTVNPENN